MQGDRAVGTVGCVDCGDRAGCLPEVTVFWLASCGWVHPVASCGQLASKTNNIGSEAVENPSHTSDRQLRKSCMDSRHDL